MTLPDRSTRFGVSAKASDTPHPVWCRVRYKVRAARSAAVRYRRRPWSRTTPRERLRGQCNTTSVALIAQTRPLGRLELFRPLLRAVQNPQD